MQGTQHLQKYFDNPKEDENIHMMEKDQTFYGNGKILLSGEYFVLDGALSIGLPTQVGQTLSVKYTPSFNPTLTWKSFDPTGKLWFETEFEFWHFDFIDENPTEESKVLQKILRATREQNKHFLRDNMDVQVTTQLGFPLDWGLGSSSTLIHNIADWAYISPFKLLFDTFGGSGYDIACAQSDGPILYQRGSEGPNWSPSSFDPQFKDKLYFVYLNKKQNSRSAIEYYIKKRPHPPEVIESISQITKDMLKVKSIEEFCFLMDSHESVISKNLEMQTVKELLFSDFNGAIKSLGAWGGDFVLVASTAGLKYVESYFMERGHNVVIPYKDLILESKVAVENNENIH